FSFYSYAHHRDLHSFPTRRSSDLLIIKKNVLARSSQMKRVAWSPLLLRRFIGSFENPRYILKWLFISTLIGIIAGIGSIAFYARSEEHTSELQSRRDLVCRLLLEK